MLFAASSPRTLAMDVTPPHPPSEQEYWAQFERKEWDQAILAAEKLVEASRLTSNDAPFDLADHLVLLGNAQLANRNYIAASAAFSETLQLLEQQVTPSSDRLLDPLRGMGYTLAAAGKHELALPYMERALLVSRRAHGLFNSSQLGLLRQIAASHVKLDNYPAAEQQMAYLLRVGEQTYGANDPRIASIHVIVGDFYVQAGLIGDGRESYQEALRVVERKLGKNDLATVEPLRSYAYSFRRELELSGLGYRTGSERQTDSMPGETKAMNPRYLNAEGERALKRALHALDSHPTRSTPVLIDTLLDLGDWFMIKSQPDEAMPHYRRAFDLLDELESEHSPGQRAKMSFPVQVYYPLPMLATRYWGRSDDDVEQVVVHVSFTVAADGSVRDETVIEENATSRQMAETLASVRAARYRPRFVDGEPVATQNISVRQVFRQRKERATTTE